MDDRIIRHLARKSELDAMEMDIPDPDFKLPTAGVDVMSPEFEREKFVEKFYGDGRVTIRKKERKVELDPEKRKMADSGLQYLLRGNKGRSQKGPGKVQ